MSPLLQSHVLEFASEQPFQRGMALLTTALPAAGVGASQAQRLVQHLCRQPDFERLVETPGFELAASDQSKPAVLYLEVDGGHLRTEEGFRETKVGRLFGEQHRHLVSGSDSLGEVEPRVMLEASDFLAHLGDQQAFTARFERLVEAHLHRQPEAQLVAISDGAEWIGAWLQRRYPHAVMILDFYHAFEKLADLSKLLFRSSSQRQAWLQAGRGHLANGELEALLEAIRAKAVGRRAEVVVQAEAVMNYYRKNRYRMQYQHYRAAGYCIGSGAIESAISTVVQQRCKLVGQRWTQRVGAVLNLRAAFKSKKRPMIREFINQQMGHAQAA